jgi:isopenicillin-N epimerase
VKSEFLLDPEIAFLNHGSFGACPRAVFEAYQRYQRELEREPVDFLQRTYNERMQAARANLAEFLGCGQDDVSFVRNATYGLNLVARSVGLKEGDIVVSTDLEYGAVDRMWQTLCDEEGARFVRVGIRLPVSDPTEVVEAIRPHLGGAKALSFSHIAAETAQVFPVKALVDLAAAEGVISVVDGAHAPGQLPVDLKSIGADFYVGNCHKWMCAPKGAAFVYADARWAEQGIRPPIVGWGHISAGSSSLLLENEWQGTSDVSAFFAVADAIEFQREHRWADEVVPKCERLLAEATPALLEVTGQESLYTHADMRPPQLATFRLPPGEYPELHSDLFHKYKVEVPVFPTAHGFVIRVSVQAYNDAEDLERLVVALRELS